MGPVAVRGPCGKGQTRRFVPRLAASLALTLTLGAIGLARLTAGTWPGDGRAGLFVDGFRGGPDA